MEISCKNPTLFSFTFNSSWTFLAIFMDLIISYLQVNHYNATLLMKINERGKFLEKPWWCVVGAGGGEGGG